MKSVVAFAAASLAIGEMRNGADEHCAWKVGDVVDVAGAIVANHGGGYQYRLCPMCIPTFPGKKMWSCWADWEELDDDERQSMHLNDEIVGFEGSCKYQLWKGWHGQAGALAQSSCEKSGTARRSKMQLLQMQLQV